MKTQFIKYVLILPLLALLAACDGDSGSTTGAGGGGAGIASGVLDTSFGGSGFVIHDNAAGGSDEDNGRALVLDASGNILVAGDSRAISNFDLALWRFTSSGAPDTSFGSNGIVTQDSAAGGGGTERGQAITLDAAGNILAVGASWNGANTDMALWRFTPSGALDTSFGSNGIVIHNNAAGGNATDWGLALALDASGNILVSGFSWGTSGNFDMVVWRFTSSGVLDASFGNNGIVVDKDAAGGSGSDYGSALVVDAGGNILVAGYSTNTSSNTDLALWRFDPSGAPDTSFGNNGIVIHNDAAGGNGDDRGNALVLDASGNILVAGASINANLDDDMALWRFTPSGALDINFGNNGIVTHNNAAGVGGRDIDLGNAVALDASGNVLVAGESSNANFNRDMALWRFTSSGVLDTSFGNNGIVIHNDAAGGNDNDRGFALALDAGGNILVTGNSVNVNGDADMVLWRYR